MDIYFWILLIAFPLGLYMAWNIGANDVANAMGTSVGSGALSFKQAVVCAGIFEFLGAVLVGGHVTQTIRKGIINPETFVAMPEHLAMGMMAALLASGLWLHLASHFGLPVSTTHSIVGGVIGFGFIVTGPASVEWGKVGQIVISWVVSPVSGGLLSFLMFTFIRSKVLDSEHPVKALKRITPFLIFLVITILCISFAYKGLKNLHLDLPLPEALLVGSVVGVLAGLAGKLLIKKITETGDQELDLRRVEKVFAMLQIMTACYVAFAHGANDVANAIGPLAAIYAIAQSGSVIMNVSVPIWMLFLGGIGIVFGLATFGYKVIQTVGQKITEITPSRGFSAEFGAATTVLICSKMGLPISTTHTLVGAVIGVGLARGISALNLGIIRSIISSWVITIPFTAILSMVCYKTTALLLGFL